MSVVDHLRRRGVAALYLLAVGLVVAPATGVGCRARVPECASGNVCAPGEVANDLRQSQEQQIACPMYVEWGLDGGGAPMPELPPAGEGILDRDATLKRRPTASPDLCCYHWRATCPAAGPPPGAR